MQYLRIYPLTWANDAGPLLSEDSKKSGVALASGRLGAMRVNVLGQPATRVSDPDGYEEEDGTSNEGIPHSC